MTGDRDLLCALFAQQLGLATADAIFRAGNQWLARRDAGARLSDELVSSGVLSEAAARLVEGLVDEALALSDGDALATLQSLPPKVQASLSSLSATLRRGGTNPDISFDSLESPENVVPEARGRYTEDVGPDGQPVELGRGGVGRVIVVRDHVLQREVAMKELLRDITTSTRYDTLHIHGLEARFLREARVTGQLEHPAVVPVYELGRRKDGTLYFTMQRVKGRTLAQAVADAGTLEGRLAFVPDLLTVCRAIAAAHHRGVIHRDLKPQNIMLGARGETFVMDWGLARVLGRRESSERPISLAPDLTHGTDAGPVGTPSYMSPEQAWGEREQIDAKSDVWGLGALLFEVLCARAPFVGASPWDVLAEVRSSPAPKVATVCPDAPPELAAICDRALERKKEDRYESAEAMAKDLEAWLAGERVSAYDYTLRVVLRRLARRHRALTAVAGAALAGLLAVASVTAWSVRRERDEARAMATFFLRDVRQELARSTLSGEVFEQLSHSALETYAASLDLESGPRDDRLLLVDVWLDIAGDRWTNGKAAEVVAALGETEAALAPLERQFPGDVEVEARRLLSVIRAMDLALDEGQEREALEGLLAARALSSHVAAAVPQTPERLRAPQLLESRLATVLGNLQRNDEAFTAGKRAVALGEARLALAPADISVLSDLADDTLILGWLNLSRDDRPSAVAAYERAVALLREARRHRDSTRLKRSLLSGLRQLAPELRLTQPERRAALMNEARRLADELLLVSPRDSSVLYDSTWLALQDNDTEKGWALAQRLDALGLGAEFHLAFLEAAFVTGHDDVVLARHGEVSPSYRSPALALLSFVHALAGRLPEASRAAKECVESSGARLLGWYPLALRARAAAAPGEGARALEAMVAKLPSETPTQSELERAFREYAQRLEQAAGGAP
ncbi:MAG: serine/threonine-protein kinase [Myxococcota bacterium]